MRLHLAGLLCLGLAAPLRAADCDKVGAELGQLLYVNVDAWSSKSDRAIDPAYVKMVRELGIGGVLPHFGKKDYASVREATRALQAAATVPLLIGVDYLPYFYGDDVGLGVQDGFLALYADKTLSPACLERAAQVHAFLHAASGVNQALGPTVERNPRWRFLSGAAAAVAPAAAATIAAYDRMGVATTLKHYPYTPDSYDLHARSEDTKIPKEQVLRDLDVFRRLAGKADFAMSSHLLNSNVDPDDMATFSKTWVDLLRRDVGFNGLLMTDGLFMFDIYPASVKAMSGRWKDAAETKDIKSPQSIFAARAILAGHDFVFLEGTAAQTRRVFKDLSALACRDSEAGAALRARVFESYDRIMRYKTAHRAQLTQDLKADPALVTQALTLAQRFNETPKAFCADAAGFRRFEEGLGFLSPVAEPAR